MFDNTDLVKAVFGRLSLESLPLHEPILVGTFAVVATGGLALFAAITYFRLWLYLWREWFTTVDHKRIGIMYMVLGIVMLLRGFADALMMRMQQAMAFNGSDGSQPEGALIYARGRLFGTTYYGGVVGAGTVFSLTKAGDFKVVYSFGSGTDGADPAAGLVNVGGTLYGTTKYGGVNGVGTIFSVRP